MIDDSGLLPLIRLLPLRFPEKKTGPKRARTGQRRRFELNIDGRRQCEEGGIPLFRSNAVSEERCERKGNVPNVAEAAGIELASVVSRGEPWRAVSTDRVRFALTSSPTAGTCPFEGIPVSDIPFHQTAMGRDFYDRNLPELLRQVTRLNELIERLLARLDADLEDR